MNVTECPKRWHWEELLGLTLSFCFQLPYYGHLRGQQFEMKTKGDVHAVLFSTLQTSGANVALRLCHKMVAGNNNIIATESKNFDCRDFSALFFSLSFSHFLITSSEVKYRST